MLYSILTNLTTSKFSAFIQQEKQFFLMKNKCKGKGRMFHFESSTGEPDLPFNLKQPKKQKKQMETGFQGTEFQVFKESNPEETGYKQSESYNSTQVSALRVSRLELNNKERAQQTP